MAKSPTKILACWIGTADLRAAAGREGDRLGPIAQAVLARNFDEVHLLCDYSNSEATVYLNWLRQKSATPLAMHFAKLSSPTSYAEIYPVVVAALERIVREHGSNTEFTYHLSPGTPAMAAVWIIVAKTRIPAELIESSFEFGVRTVSVPFEISAEFIPDLLRGPDSRLEQLAQGHPDEAPEFEQIVHRGPAMKAVIAHARRVAYRSVPVLLEGESGTGKELLARAIHRASPRAKKPFIAINCGAIPSELVEAEFFGYKRGAFTGAHSDQPGIFEKSSGGTLFLDEVGDLPKAAQVKLLRALQENEVTRIGETETRNVDVRVIAATNRNLLAEVAANNFREDLFYRLAVMVIQLPALRERQGDLFPLVDALMNLVNSRAKGEPGYKQKKVSPDARNVLLQHAWPGNVRELLNTLQRASVWGEEDVIGVETMRAAVLEAPRKGVSIDTILHRPLGEGFSLRELLSEVARHYIERAWNSSNGSTTNAAKLIGFPNYQTFTNWAKRHDADL